jgi:uncharacterized protein YndB with AHSA1/START domain
MKVRTRGFTAAASVTINARAERVWEALTNPSLIKEYLFGTEAISDWKAGSPITYRGVWEGKPYEDKGTVLKAVPNRLLQTTFWSSLSGLVDAPENYNTITYQLSENGGQTTLSLRQENNPTREAADHWAGNWTKVLQAMKQLLEK